MKRYLTVILCLVLVLLLWGCEKNSAPNETTAETVANSSTPLTEEELRLFNQEFFSDTRFDAQDNEIFNLRNMFLRCEFDSPENIDLGVLFREGLGNPTTVSQAEIELYCQVTGEDTALDFTKTTLAEMSAVFLENTGLHLSQTLKTGLDKLVYLEEYEAFYHRHGDTAYFFPEILSGERFDDGTVRLCYRDRNSSPSALWCVILKPAGGSYYFVSNLPAE